MNNTLTIYQLEDFDNRIKTVITTSDGVEIMEIHRKGLSDVEVLRDLVGRKYFQHLKGAWSASFDGINHTVERDSFESVVKIMQEYIYSRDNNYNFIGLC